MKVRDLIRHLATLDMDAEVIIDAPFDCGQGGSLPLTGSLALPVRSLSTGFFRPEGGFSGGPWVKLNGTAVWGLDQGITE